MKAPSPIKLHADDAHARGASLMHVLHYLSYIARHVDVSSAPSMWAPL